MDMSSGESMRTTYVVVAHGVHVVLQVTLPVVGEDDAAQFSVTGEVETSVGGKHQQTSHVPPADVFLGRQDAESEDLTLNITHGVWGRVGVVLRHTSTSEPLTSQTATCMMASKPPSGESRFPEICC